MSRHIRTLIMFLSVTITLQCAHPRPDDEQRLPPLAVDPFAGLDPIAADEAQAFVVRKGPAPPPDAAERVKLPFPPPKAPGKSKQPAAPELAILRVQPAGKDGLIGAVTATFNQPMIPVASLDELRAMEPPLKVEPRVPGRFRWLGTRTISFEPRGRMPFATEFKARVAAGTRAMSGKRLERDKSWSFSTPRPKLVRSLPRRHSRQTKPDSAIAFLFNQPVDGKSLLASLSGQPRLGAGQAAFQLVPRAQWAKLKRIGAQVSTWDADRTVVLRTRKPLPLATTYTLKIKHGLRGEGPLTTRRDLYHHFTTYGPLRVTEIRCGHGSNCFPSSGFRVRFNNPVVTPDMARHITVKPAPADLEISGAAAVWYIRGSFAPRTKITVTVAAGVEDIHGQKLAGAHTRELSTGDLYPYLTFPARGKAVMERRGNRKVPLQVSSVTGSRMRMVKVQRDQLFKVIQKARYSYDNNGRVDPLKGIKGVVVKRTLKTGVPINGRRRLGIRTDEGLGPGGAGVLYIELRSEELRRFNKWANPYRGLVVAVTDIGLLARYDHDQILVLATSLQTGAPLPGVKLELRGRDGKVAGGGKTGKDGVAILPGRRQLKIRPRYALWADKGRDSTFVIIDPRGVGAGNYVSSYASYGYAPAKKRLKMFLFTDRNPYRPGEKVHLKGILRMEDSTPDGGVEPLPADLTEVKIRVNTARGRKLVEQDKIKLSPSGAFTIDVDIPVETDLGRYRVYVTSRGGSAHGTFQVEAYRAPEFAVKVDAEDRPRFFGDSLVATVSGDYLFGAPMSGARASWTLRRAEANFRPPRNDGFQFGEHLPHWLRWRFAAGRRGGRHGGYARQAGARGKIIARGQGSLDAAGKLVVDHKLEADAQDRRHGPAAFTLEAQVVDQNRQSIAGRKVVTVHTASKYIGLRPAKAVIKAGQPAGVAGVLVDLAGARIAGKPLTIRALQLKSKMTPIKEGGEWRYAWKTTEVEVARCALTTAAAPTSCDLTLAKPGAYLVRGEIKDERGRLARTTIRMYAYGPGHVPWRLKNQSRIELVPDKERYEPGDVARVLVKSPLTGTRGFLTFSRSGMVRHRALEMKGNAQVVEIPITDKHLPELYVGVALGRGRIKVKGKGGRDLGRPTFAHGQVKLPVTVRHKRLTVEVSPSVPTVRPSGSFTLKLRTTDSSGRPVPGEVAVMAVDEGVLSLMNYATPDPLAFFWASRRADTGLADTRNDLLKQENKLARPKPRVANRRSTVLRSAMPRPSRTGVAPPAPPSEMSESPTDDFGGEREEDRRGNGGGGKKKRIRARSNFATTAYFNPSVITGDDGNAAVKITMPDNLTTFRIMAVALDRGKPDRFGKGEAQIKVRKPLLLRPSLPRFLSVGDRFEAAVMVHNETDADSTVDVLVRGRNIRGVNRDGSPGDSRPRRKRVKIKAHRAAEVRFTLEPRAAGPARLQFAAVMGKETDAVEKQIPVLLPVTTEAFATYGATDSSVAQAVSPPANALPGHGGLEISMSSTALNGLEDAVKYLIRYPHGCTEQVASRLLPIFGLKDILKDFDIEGLGDADRRRKMADAGIRRLISHQRWDGGWGMWSGSRHSWPYLTAYAMFTLQRARDAGRDVPAAKINKGARFLKRILDNPRREFGEQHAYTTQAISVWALSGVKQFERKHMKRLFGLRTRLPLFARIWLMQAIFRADGPSAQVKTLLRELNNAAVQTASAAHFAEVKTESLRLLMHSEDRTDAIALYALLEVAPADPLLPRLARGLLQSRVRGTWSTTQANAYALTALARYYKQFEKVVPDYVARLWLGEAAFLGQARFRGRQMKVVQQKVPLAALQKLGRQDLILDKQGPGKLYYRIGLRYAPTDLRLPPEEQGFSVTRTYEPVEGKGGTVQRGKDGVWNIKAGAYVRVRLAVVVPDRRYYVAVSDPLPAGLEPVNMKFATSARSRLGNQLKNKVYDFHSWYALFAFDHKEMRDDSVVLFSDRLPSGVYEYTYLARATTLGRFVSAPTKAEEMYRPETFGRSATAIVEIK